MATSVGGAAQFQVTKAAFAFIIRTLPYIPFAKAFNDKVSAAALRYHIKAALNKSHSIESFKQNLNKIANRVEFNNATKALLREIEQALPRSTQSEGVSTSGELKPNREVSTTPITESGGSVSSGITQAIETKALESSKVKGASEAGVSEAKTLQNEAPVSARSLQSETAEVGQSGGRTLQDQTPLKVQDEALPLTKAQEIQDTELTPKNVGNNVAESETLPTKTKLERELSPQEIHEVISKWDLKNPSPKDKLLIGRVQGEELEQLAKEFKFKGNYALAREIDAQHVAHALNRHSDVSVETSRNQIPITLEDITNYPNIIKNGTFQPPLSLKLKSRLSITQIFNFCPLV
nr:hypothetical protein [Helicobacter suis]